MKVKEAIVLRFTEICRERKIKWNELATMSGVTPSTVYSMIKPTRKELSVITVKRLCDGLEITLMDFFNSPLFEDLDLEIEN